MKTSSLALLGAALSGAYLLAQLSGAIAPSGLGILASFHGYLGFSAIALLAHDYARQKSLRRLPLGAAS